MTLEPRSAPTGRPRRDEVADVDAIDQLVDAVTLAVYADVKGDRFDFSVLGAAKGVMLDHLRSARMEGPLT